MSFRHYTKLKEIADRVGCDSSDCTTNGDLLDRIYETPITPVEPTGPIDAKIDIPNIKARFVRPVEGHSYLGLVTFSADTWLLELDNVIGYKVEGQNLFYYPVASSGKAGGVTYWVLFNDVENSNSGNIFLGVNSGNTVVGLTDEQISNIKNNLPFTLEIQSVAGRLTITEIIDD